MNVSKYLLFNSHSRPPSFPSPPPLSTTFLCFSLLTCLAHLLFLTLHPQTAQSTSIWLYTFFFSLISSLRSSWYFCHNSFTFSRLLPGHFVLCPKHQLHEAFSPLNISNNLRPLHFQHCFFSTSSNTISPHGNPVLSSSQMFSPITFLNTALTHLAIHTHILNSIYYCHLFKPWRAELTIKYPHRIWDLECSLCIHKPAFTHP